MITYDHFLLDLRLSRDIETLTHDQRVMTMASRPKTGVEIARPDVLTRRGLVVGAPATAFAASAGAAAGDESVAACENWLALNAEHDRLAHRWQKLEAQLARQHNFLKLSRRQQRRLPQARELYEIEDRLEQLHKEKQTLLTLLPTFVATSAFGLAGKLAVAAIEVCPEENEEAHRLISSILRDLKAMTPAGG